MQTRISKLEHDHKVREQALFLLSQGYHVEARIEGWFHAPKIICGYRPDIVAKKRGQRTRIVEVKKGPFDWPKVEALKRFADEHAECDLRVIER